MRSLYPVAAKNLVNRFRLQTKIFASSCLCCSKSGRFPSNHQVQKFRTNSTSQTFFNCPVHSARLRNVKNLNTSQPYEQQRFAVPALNTSNEEGPKIFPIDAGTVHQC
jgi:hypothetical protein